MSGLDVHFIHVRPPHRENQKVLPIMIVHGWPGSFYEFYKILPLLTQSCDGVVFEVICPSIPGYGFSEASHKQGRIRLLILNKSGGGYSQMCLHCRSRVQQPRRRPDFPEADGAFGLLSVLSAGRGLGLAHHHQHGTDEASVSATKTENMPQVTRWNRKSLARFVLMETL